MEFPAELWMPIVVSAAAVFLVSSVAHLLLKYHQSDYARLPDEGLVGGLRDVAPGNYVVPHASDLAEMKSEAYQQRLAAGPVCFVHLRPNGTLGMGTALVQWFVYSLLVGVFCAYLGALAIEPDSAYLDRFQVTGAVAFLGYAFMAVHEAMWKAGKWSTTLKFMLDGTVYALVTAGIFAALWPGA